MAKKRRRGRRKSGNWFTRMSLAKKIGLTLGCVIIGLATASVVFVAAKWSKVEVNTIAKSDLVINETVKEQLGTGYTNIAFFGGDSREGKLETDTNTDTIIIASLNNETKEVKMVSVYRDTLLDVTGKSKFQKANSAYAGGGPTQAINMLNRNLDMDIQSYVTVDFSVVTDVIDLLGGVEIDVKDYEVEYINKFLGETASVAGKEAVPVTQAGVQTLDGCQATTYARIRSTAGGDFKRTDRQRYVIEQMVKKIKKCDIGKINTIVDTVLPKISTNFTATDIAKYAAFYNEYTIGSNTGFPEVVGTAEMDGKGSVVIPQTLESNVKTLHEFFFPDDAYTPSSTVTSISSKITSLTSGLTDGAAKSNETYKDHASANSTEDVETNVSPMADNPSPTFGD